MSIKQNKTAEKEALRENLRGVQHKVHQKFKRSELTKRISYAMSSETDRQKMLYARVSGLHGTQTKDIAREIDKRARVHENDWEKFKRKIDGRAADIALKKRSKFFAVLLESFGGENGVIDTPKELDNFIRDGLPALENVSQLPEHAGELAKQIQEQASQSEILAEIHTGQPLSAKVRAQIKSEITALLRGKQPKDLTRLKGNAMLDLYVKAMDGNQRLDLLKDLSTAKDAVFFVNKWYLAGLVSKAQIISVYSQVDSEEARGMIDYINKPSTDAALREATMLRKAISAGEVKLRNRRFGHGGIAKKVFTLKTAVGVAGMLIGGSAMAMSATKMTSELIIDKKTKPDKGLIMGAAFAGAGLELSGGLAGLTQKPSESLAGAMKDKDAEEKDKRASRIAETQRLVTNSADVSKILFSNTEGVDRAIRNANLENRTATLEEMGFNPAALKETFPELSTEKIGKDIQILHKAMVNMGEGMSLKTPESQKSFIQKAFEEEFPVFTPLSKEITTSILS